jgi:methylthioribulose-1-phosphate dehydratase
MATFHLAGSNACIHSHSKNAVLATLLFEKEFRVSHLEMIKGIRRSRSGTYYRFDEELVVPIIANTPFEQDLEASFRECMERYPEASCILVKRHGFYCWGPSWQQAKAMSECFDYLFETAVEMHRLGIPTVKSVAVSNGSNSSESK